MKTLYLDCSMGAAGDMLTAALLELLPDRAAFLRELEQLGLPGVRFAAEPAVKCGITGTHITVTVDGAEEDEEHHHHHHGLTEIAQLFDSMPLSDRVKAHAKAVYDRIAQAESRVHGVPVTQVHFHEVGALDAVADVTAVCLLLEKLKPDRIVASPVHVGSGTVRCAHGILPVPAPATAELLRGVPIYGGEIAGELCTPTGAALLQSYVQEFGAMPAMTVEAIGYGMGKKDFPRANCVRAMLGESGEPAPALLELCCNLDDMTGEALGFAQEQLLEAGALDVWTEAIGMKKSRPAVKLSVLCAPEKRDCLLACLFRYTTTLGVRETPCRRHQLTRTVETVETAFGSVRRKISTGFGVTRTKWEYEDLAQIAREQHLSLEEVRERLEKEKS